MNEITYTRVLTIAGSDSGGGAGIQADLKTFSALGTYGMSVITALTAQNTRAVTGIHPVPAEFVVQQMDAVFDDIHVDAVKIGMLQSAEIVRAVADRLRAHLAERIVIDPVMVAKSGDRLLRDDAVEALRQHLIPLGTVITPNLPEAEDLLGTKIGNADEMEAAARRLLQTGAKSVLIKGGHAEGDLSQDCLAIRVSDDAARVRWLSAPRIDTPNTHGTGCTLSSAIAAHLGQGSEIEEAVVQAKEYVTGAIEAGARRSLGHGHGPVHHFHRLWSD